MCVFMTHVSARKHYVRRKSHHLPLLVDSMDLSFASVENNRTQLATGNPSERPKKKGEKKANSSRLQSFTRFVRALLFVRGWLFLFGFHQKFLLRLAEHDDKNLQAFSALLAQPK